LTLLAGLASAVSGAAPQARAQWVITDLDALGTNSWALDINDDGWIVGQRSTVRHGKYAWTHGVLWKARSTTDLGTCKRRAESSAAAINDFGQIVGTCGFWGGSEANSRAFLWERGRLRELGWLPGRDKATRATSINERGQIVGWSQSRGGLPRAFLWEDGKMIDLGTLPGGHKSEAEAINEKGTIVGWSGNGRVPHAVLWEKGQIRNLGTLPGTSTSIAVAINNRGQIVGQSYSPGGETHAVLWWRGSLVDLGTLPGGHDSVAMAINDRGQVIGTSHTRGNHTHSFMWEGGRMHDLGTLGGEWSHANALNGRGLVVGQTTSSTELWEGTPAFVWEGGTMVGLPTLPRGEDAEAFAVSANGHVVGYSNSIQHADLVQHAVLWTLKRG
jgi:probable HAF family extracellular repeat protein